MKYIIPKIGDNLAVKASALDFCGSRSPFCNLIGRVIRYEPCGDECLCGWCDGECLGTTTLVFPETPALWRGFLLWHASFFRNYGFGFTDAIEDHIDKILTNLRDIEGKVRSEVKTEDLCPS